jgi:hypothetical protein
VAGQQVGVKRQVGKSLLFGVAMPTDYSVSDRESRNSPQINQMIIVLLLGFS